MYPDDGTTSDNPSHRETFGFFGLGAMGMPIARNLASTVKCMAICDLSAERVDRLLETAPPSVVTDSEILATAKTVFLCLPSQLATRQVVEDLVSTPVTDRVIIDFGAHPPKFVSEMSAICKSISVQFCDCPVFGTPLMAERSELYFLFSGPEQVSKWFEDLVVPLGYRTRFAGSVGTASLLKLLQNAIGAANLAVGAEALRICEATDVDTSLFIGIVRECGGIGQSSVFDRYADDMAARKDSGDGRLRIAAKDMRSVVSLATSANVSAPLLVETDRQYSGAMQDGLGDQQFTDIINFNDAEK